MQCGHLRHVVDSAQCLHVANLSSWGDNGMTHSDYDVDGSLPEPKGQRATTNYVVRVNSATVAIDRPMGVFA